MIFIIVAAIILIVASSIISYRTGIMEGKLRSEEKNIQALLKTVQVLTDAQREVGITPEQISKINEVLQEKLIKNI